VSSDHVFKVGDIVRCTSVMQVNVRERSGKVVSLPERSELTIRLGVITRLGIGCAAVSLDVFGETPDQWRTAALDGGTWYGDIFPFGSLEYIPDETLMNRAFPKPVTYAKGDLVEINLDSEWRQGVIVKTINPRYCRVLVDGEIRRARKTRLLLTSRALKQSRSKIKKQEAQ
jgi:hypothetical protein